MSARWEHFEHGADIGVRGIADSEEGAFEQAALAMTAVVTDIAKVRLTTSIHIHCEAPDHELLLTEWLNAIIFEMATLNMLFGKFDLHLDKEELNGVISGEVVDVARHMPAVEIKGATYTSLKVYQDDRGHWIAQCVVDV